MSVTSCNYPTLDVSKEDEVGVVRIYNVYIMTELQCSIHSVVYFFFYKKTAMIQKGNKHKKNPDRTYF